MFDKCTAGKTTSLALLTSLNARRSFLESDAQQKAGLIV